MKPALSQLPNNSQAAIQTVIGLMKRQGHAVFENDSLPGNLNIVGIRNAKAQLDEFGCEMVIFWKYRGVWSIRRWACTTYPGSRYLVDRLLNPKGAAILCPGQYRGIYQLDLHGGRYEALCQRRGPVRVYRDGNRDQTFDLDPRSVQSGSFGINIHAPLTVRDGVGSYCALRVLAASAGCQVFRCVADFLEARHLWRVARANFGNRFTYTLLDPSPPQP